MVITKHFYEAHLSCSQLWAGGLHSVKKLTFGNRCFTWRCQCTYLFVGHSWFGRMLEDLAVLLRGTGG